MSCWKMNVSPATDLFAGGVYCDSWDVVVILPIRFTFTLESTKYIQYVGRHFR